MWIILQTSAYGIDSTSTEEYMNPMPTSSQLQFQDQPHDVYPEGAWAPEQHNRKTFYSSQTSIRKFKCSYCNARFKAKQHLQNHERRHTGEKFTCFQCGSSFCRRSVLKLHILQKHCL